MQEFQAAFHNLYKTSNIPKYRSFQYRLLHRAVITNVHLHRWKKRSDDLCTFCGREAETYKHIFGNCTQLSDIWTAVETLSHEFGNGELTIDTKNIILKHNL